MGLQRHIRTYLNTLNVTEATEKRYRYAINRYIRWMKANGFHNVGTACRYYKIDLERDGMLSKSTVKFYVTEAKAFSRWLSETKMSEGYEIPDRTKLGMGLPKLPEKLVQSDLQFICSYLARMGVDGLRNRAIFLLAYVCNLTCEEIHAIRPENLLVSDNGAWLTLEDDDGAFQFPIPDHAARAISDYISVRTAPRGDLPLFIHSDTASPMSPKLIWKVVTDACRLLYIDPEEAIPSDSKAAVVLYLTRLGAKGKRRLATYASCLYYTDMTL